jgi:hypothetical protein
MGRRPGSCELSSAALIAGLRPGRALCPRPVGRALSLGWVDTCASAAAEWAEPLRGTAASAGAWLLLEQPGPWGAKALTRSHLDPGVGRALEARAAAAGLRVGLIRRPGRHSDDHHPGKPRSVFLAGTFPGGSEVRTLRITDPAQLLELDLTSAETGEPYAGDPLAFVCTNGRRDRCCALLGRPLAEELAASGYGAVWETTHLGGHRFAPTMLVLPYGYAYGRLSAFTAKEVLEATREGRMLPEPCRGRSTWDRPGQAAELAVRELAGETAAEALTVCRSDGAQRVRHRDGRVWEVEVTAVECTPPRPESCGKAPAGPLRMEAAAIRQVA